MVLFDADIITNSEYVSLTDKDMKLCAQRMQNEANGSNYDIMTTYDYLVLKAARRVCCSLLSKPIRIEFSSITHIARDSHTSFSTAFIHSNLGRHGQAAANTDVKQIG